MKIKLILTALLLALMILSFSQKKEPVAGSEMDALINELMQRMTMEEKIGQLNLLPGYEDIVTGEATSSEIGKKILEGKVGAVFNLRTLGKIREMQRIAVEESRNKIPLMFGLDVIHGYRTVFPIPLGLAASFDMDLIERSASIAASEATADGLCWNFSPMVDLTRDPRWGRIAEGFGEDPYLGSRFAEAFVRGYQGDDLSKNNTMMACVKHMALYGAAESGLDYNTTDMSRLRMFNEYFPPYLAGIRAGAGSVMTSFNEVDGIPASGNRWLLTEVLRDNWGFDGFVVTDYTAVNEMMMHGVGDLQTVSAMALKAGVDLDMVGEGFLTTLGKSLEEKRITPYQIDQACRRILEAKYKLGLFHDPYRYCYEERSETEIFTEENNRIARELAAQTFVLLKNEGQILPLKPQGKIALIGPLADSRMNMAGTWSVAVDHNQSITVLEGFRDAVGNMANVYYAKGANITDDPKLDQRSAVRRMPTIDTIRTPEQLRDEAVALAAECDVVLAVMGESAEMSGESSSRTDLQLPGSQRELLKALMNTGKPLVLVVFAGRPLILDWEKEIIPAILNVWFGGTQSGNAIADVVFGKVNPSAKLPVTFPRSVGQIPIYYNHKNTGRPLDDDEWFKKFRTNYLDIPNEPLWPFGYGLSYTNFDYGKVVLDKTEFSEGQELKASINVRNSGSYDGAEVVQLYIRDMVGSITRPVKELKGFQKVHLKAGEQKTITFTVQTEDLAFYHDDMSFFAEKGEFILMIGSNSSDTQAIGFSYK
ncbi:MAG: beta-glucosidase BglX [Bacteroidales bacterium]|nr:beta-glucosidase BglX [Bacteroidales bacterium]